MANFVNRVTDVLTRGTATALSPGEVVPPFEAIDQEGRTVTSESLRGSYVLLYFYPADDTPGCTAQACALRDDFPKFRKRGVTVYGVSAQDAASHQKFKEKYKLPFDLLVDAKGEVAKAVGVERVPLIGIHRRQSVLIDPDGRLLAFFRDVDPATHADVILQALPAEA